MKQIIFYYIKLDVRETGYVCGKWADILQDKNQGASQYTESLT